MCCMVSPFNSPTQVLSHVGRQSCDVTRSPSTSDNLCGGSSVRMDGKDVGGVCGQSLSREDVTGKNNSHRVNSHSVLYSPIIPISKPPHPRFMSGWELQMKKLSKSH
jgi:hypothetical protein